LKLQTVRMRTAAYTTGVRPRFYVPEATAEGVIHLSADEAHHLRHVLRLREGAELSVFNGQGREWTGRVLSADRQATLAVELLSELAPVPEPAVRVTLGIGLLKGDQMDGVVRDATMLGVARIVPVVSSHVVVPARAWRGDAALTRWHRVAVSSAKQCGRAVVPQIAPASRFDEVLEAADEESRLICVEPLHGGTAMSTLRTDPRPDAALALVGPEGGWSTAELAAADARGFRRLHLGPRTLRAETAPTVLLSALWTAWGWSA
jgi:16S rRNA (uracil1498-N3)-methyltransferase